MATTDRPGEQTARDLAAQLRDAEFVRLVAAGDGDSVAAGALIVAGLEACSVPYHLSVTPRSQAVAGGTDAEVVLGLGRSVADATEQIGGDSPATRTAAGVARELDTVDHALALAGTMAAEGRPADDLASAARFEQQPGVGIPTSDRADGLAHSTLVSAPFSGDLGAAESLLDSLEVPACRDEETGRRLASRVALAVASDEDGTERGACRVGRFLRPLAGGPFETIPGYADVLETLAPEEPGLAVAVALGRADRARALEAWRTHAMAAHEAVRASRVSRHDGLTVVRCDGRPPVDAVARLVTDFRSPEPVVLVVGDGIAAARATGDASIDVGATLSSRAASAGGVGGGTSTRGRASFETEPAAFVAAVKEAT